MISASAQLGFNNNVKHKGRVFHIQTEDSGIKKPHIITHLFVEGGRILKSVKVSYAEFLEEAELTKKVRALMQEQHKAMFIALRAGKFDHMFGEGPAPAAEGATAPAAAAPAPAPDSSKQEAAPESAAENSLVGAAAFAAAPPSEATPDPAPELAPTKAGPIPAPRAERLSAPPPPPSVPAPRPVSEPPRKPSTKLERPQARQSFRPPPSPSAPSESSRLRALANDPPMPPARRSAPHRPPMSSGLELDLEALERAAVESTRTRAPATVRDLPPPPSKVLRPTAPTNTGYRSVTPQATRVTPARPSEPGNRAPMPRKYTPSRPASIFGNARPQAGSSIFGEDLISEKSLDEVILGYLSEDLDRPGKKK